VSEGKGSAADRKPRIALVPPAVAGAIFDATGAHPRKLPFNAANMAALLKDKSGSA
jgi:CO/xanthine dehydrogenase Mo-binding subunit